MTDIRKMQVGQVVDFCISYNKRQKQAEKQAKAAKNGTKRKATPEDFRAFFG